VRFFGMPDNQDDQSGHRAGLFNAQYMTRMSRIASIPPKAMR
jgi:hypothetical protein